MKIIKIYNIPIDNCENYENLRMSIENQEKHCNHKISLENHERHQKKEFHVRNTKIKKIHELYKIILKIMKT